MNSWHTFSPNGKWLAFSSKSRSPYTQLMLTHIDANGNDTPAILVENTTAANRAVNIPEFVNVDSEDSIAKIDPQATEFYKMVDQAFVLARNNHLPEAIEMLRSALQRDPDDAMAHFNLANLLNATQQSGDALAEFRKASALNPEETTFLESLGMSLEMNGRRDEALVELRKAADLDPTSAAFVFNLGSVMEWNGDYAGALGALEKASKLSDSNNLRIEFGLAQAFDKAGNPSKAIETARHALDLATAAHDEQAEKEIQQFLDPDRNFPAPGIPEPSRFLLRIDYRGALDSSKPAAWHPSWPSIRHRRILTSSHPPSLGRLPKPFRHLSQNNDLMIA
jgi:Flp pilus assembly protein TadD